MDKELKNVLNWTWNIAIWICIIAAIIGLLTACQSESGKRARKAREARSGDTILVYTSPAKDKLYKLDQGQSSDLWFVQNCHGEITLLVRQ